MKPWLAAVIVLIFSGALPVESAPVSLADTRVEVIHPDLAIALQDVKKMLSTPRTPLAFDNGATAKNCAEYSNLLATSAPDESVRNAEVRAEYLVCDAVRLISSEPFQAVKRTLPTHAAQALFEQLDLRSFPSSLRNGTDDQKHTLKTLLASAKVTMTDNAVEVETSEQFFSLHIVGVIRRSAAKGSTKTHQNEWIVWAGDELKDGNYKSYRTLIVRPPSRASGGRYMGSMYPPQ